MAIVLRVRATYTLGVLCTLSVYYVQSQCTMATEGACKKIGKKGLGSRDKGLGFSVMDYGLGRELPPSLTLYIYIHVYIHTLYIHTYKHTYIHTYIHTYTHTHTHTYIHREGT